MRAEKDVYRVLVGKPEGKETLGISRRIWAESGKWGCGLD
jgi:hypothetical protein